MADSDHSAALHAAVNDALAERLPVQIRAGGSKDFYGREAVGEILDVSAHRGIVNYQPGELFVTARAGTPLAELESVLDQSGQRLPFEPPHFGDGATVGGAIACGLSGPGRPWSGATRDLVLGTRIINGRGEVLRFGGEVMKNVAGYDVSRLMAGALGTLGLLLDISLKVLPKPEREITLAFEIGANEAVVKVATIACAPMPISAAAYVNGYLYLRLSGAKAGVDAASDSLGGEAVDDDIWMAVREHTHPFFTRREENLWRLSCAPATRIEPKLGPQLIDWGGAQRWFFSEDSAIEIRARTAACGGHASCFRRAGKSTIDEVFHPLDATKKKLHAAVKKAFDPLGIFNPGRLYRESEGLS